MNCKSIEGNERFERVCAEARPRQFGAAEVTRRSGGWPVNWGREGKSWTTDIGGLVSQNSPTHVGGYGAKSLISRLGLLQVVDFHDISGYFSWVWRPFAVALLFSKVQKHFMQLVDFHDSFRYFS